MLFTELRIGDRVSFNSITLKGGNRKVRGEITQFMHGTKGVSVRLLIGQSREGENYWTNATMRGSMVHGVVDVVRGGQAGYFVPFDTRIGKSERGAECVVNGSFTFDSADAMLAAHAS